MFARITSGKVKIDRLDGFEKVYTDSVIPEARKQKGYLGAYLLIDKQTGKTCSITYWESEEDALANEESRYYQEQLIKTYPYRIDGPVREGFEVAFMDKDIICK